MVIFHSYVKLPEGKIRPSPKKQSQQPRSFSGIQLGFSQPKNIGRVKSMCPEGPEGLGSTTKYIWFILYALYTYIYHHMVYNHHYIHIYIYIYTTKNNEMSTAVTPLVV